MTGVVCLLMSMHNVMLLYHNDCTTYSCSSCLCVCSVGLLTLGACASEVGLCVCVCVCVCVSVCLSGLNLRLQGSRATNYYTYVFFTMNARFDMCGVR